MKLNMKSDVAINNKKKQFENSKTKMEKGVKKKIIFYK